jgi:ABC-type transport system involved in Fe-S cluster assembly fused permease/ATPase subunit
MIAQIEVSKRFPLRLSSPVIVIGYVLTLFAVVAAAVAFPFSMISMVLLFIVVGAFFALVVPILLMVYLFFTIALYRAMMAFGRRLIAGAGHDAESLDMSYLSLLKNDVAPEQIDMGLWDRWIDGA